MAHLKGMAEITEYTKSDRRTVLLWMKERGFPIRRIGGNVWYSETTAIDEWFRKQVTPDCSDGMQER